MNYILKGISSFEIIDKLPEFDSYAFDLRPRSFNFTQAYQIKNMIEKVIVDKNIILLFENEKAFVVDELISHIKSSLHTTNELICEFSGQSSLQSLDEYQRPFFWRYHNEEKLINISSSKELKKIIFLHRDLEMLNSSGELFGFLNLFANMNVHFELQIDWDTNLIESMFEYFRFDTISFEINSKVEHSYRQLDFELAKVIIKNIKDIML